MLYLVVSKCIVIFFLNDFQLSVVIKIFKIYPIHLTTTDKLLSFWLNAIWAVLCIGVLFFVLNDVIVHKITLTLNKIWEFQGGLLSWHTPNFLQDIAQNESIDVGSYELFEGVHHMSQTIDERV